MPFRKTVALEDRWQADYRENSPPPKKRRAFYVAGVRKDAVGGKLLRLGSAKAPTLGIPKGSQPLGPAFFPNLSGQVQRKTD